MERKDIHCAVAVNVALVPGGSRMNRMRACDAMRFAALWASTGRFSRSCLAAGLDPGGFPRASTSYVCGAAAIPPCAANCRQPDAVRESRSCHRSGQPVRLTRCRTPRRSPISSRFARVDAKKRPSDRSPPSLSIRLCQLWALKFSRSKVPASSAEIEAFPWRKSRPV
jgi:hypothetical protein